MSVAKRSPVKRDRKERSIRAMYPPKGGRGMATAALYQSAMEGLRPLKPPPVSYGLQPSPNQADTED